MQIEILISGEGETENSKFSDATVIAESLFKKYRILHVPNDFICDDDGNVYRVDARQLFEDNITIWVS